MINFEKFQLENGLRVIIHEDKTAAVTAINLLYDVGAKDETPDKTGFAHLFEHLMFGGSINIPNYDGPLQDVGGENNAFTSNDITNYYITLPTNNIETGLWLESDRMLSLAFTDESLEIQRNVVIEEYKQRYLNQPYGDVWLLLRPLAYKKHTYRWPTIGAEISHIEDATMEDVKAFFKKFYIPNNAILTIAGPKSTAELKPLVEKWFGDIPKGERSTRNIEKEPQQTEKRLLKVERKVPLNAIYKAYHMCERNHPDYYTTDLISDILSRGESSRLYRSLVKDQKLFSSLDAYIMGSHDEGLFVVSGKLTDGVTMEEADLALQKQLNEMIKNPVLESELEKVKTKVESGILFSETSCLNKAMGLSLHELLGDANNMNTEIANYQKVNIQDIQRVATTIFKETNCSTLYYYAKY